jgi:hypothetical protein
MVSGRQLNHADLNYKVTHCLCFRYNCVCSIQITSHCLGITSRHVACYTSSISPTTLCGFWPSQTSHSKLAYPLLIPSSFSLSASLGHHTHRPTISISVFPVVGSPLGSILKFFCYILSDFCLYVVQPFNPFGFDKRWEPA